MLSAQNDNSETGQKGLPVAIGTLMKSAEFTAWMVLERVRGASPVEEFPWSCPKIVLKELCPRGAWMLW